MTSKSETSGWFFGIGAFVIWGLAPIYFKAVSAAPAEEILAHRIAWSVPVTLLLMWLLKKRVQIKKVIQNKKLFWGLFISTLLISSNWYIFTWAVTHEKILATSLGYFINPVMSILMGVILLGERLTKIQWCAVLAVTLGVLNQIINFGEVPWIALSLATTFALYGFIRKQLDIDSLNGLLIETAIALPVALGYILWVIWSAKAVFLQLNITTDLLLISGGIVTAIPLIMFAASAKKIPLNSIGFLQFIAPSISFLLATQFYAEPLGKEQLISFVFIWIGLLLYLVKPMQNIMKKSLQKETKKA